MENIMNKIKGMKIEGLTRIELRIISDRIDEEMVKYKELAYGQNGFNMDGKVSILNEDALNVYNALMKLSIDVWRAIQDAPFDIEAWNDEVEFELEMEAMEMEAQEIVEEVQETSQEVVKAPKVKYNPLKAKALKRAINDAIKLYNLSIDAYAQNIINYWEYMEAKKNLNHMRAKLARYEVECGVWRPSK